MCVSLPVLLLTALTAQAQETPVFRTTVDLVLVPVVVRDSQGNAVGHLKPEDFELFDNGKRQRIVKFSLEGTVRAQPTTANRASPTTVATAAERPQRFVAYLFDDLHAGFAEIARSRDAARRHFATLAPSDRAALFTTSGQVTVDFTDERGKLEAAAMRLLPRPQHTPGCPDLSYYLADLVANRRDRGALSVLMQMEAQCIPAGTVEILRNMAESDARRVAAEGEQALRATFDSMRAVVRRMAALPGQRTVLLVSPGFIVPQFRGEQSDLMNQAARANVVVNALDARGVYTDSTYDASKAGVPSTAKTALDRSEQLAQGGVLEEFAHATGGTVFRNSNDLDDGFRRLASPPEYWYVLGFTPSEFKDDGKYRSLKVTLPRAKGLTVLARRGYLPPKPGLPAADREKQDRDAALFSYRQVGELPVSLTVTSEGATVSAVALLDLKPLVFRKSEGLNLKKLTVVSGLFDWNGTFLRSSASSVDLRLPDAKLAELAPAGLPIRITYDLIPGRYLVRVVVQDTEAGRLSIRDESVEVRH